GDVVGRGGGESRWGAARRALCGPRGAWITSMDDGRRSERILGYRVARRRDRCADALLVRLGPASVAFDDLVKQPDQQSPLAGIEACQHIGFARNEAADDRLIELLSGVGQMQHPATAVRNIGFARNQLLFLQLLDRACDAGFGPARHAAYLLRIEPRLSRQAK